MRLLLVVDEVNLGGAELSFLELSRSLAARAEVHLALGEPALRRHSAVYHALDGAVSLHACPTPLNPGTWSNLHRSLRRRPAGEVADLIVSLRPSAIVVNLPTVERGQAIVDATEVVSPKPPVWGLLHLVHPPSVIGAKLGRLRDLMVKSLLARFDRLVTVSDSGARQLSRRYGLQAAVFHPPTVALRPVASTQERSRQRSELGWPPGFILGMVGRVQLHHKGQDVALRVLAGLRQKGLSPHLVVMGDGPDLPTLRRLAEAMGLSSSVSFLGWRHDAGTLIPLLDAMLLPSRFEGLPQTALQAATAHVPVVGYAVDGLADFLPTRFRVAYGDERGLIDALSDLHRGTLPWPSEKLAERAAEWGNPERSAERLLRLISE